MAKKLAIEDWFVYLDQQDRLLRVLERAKPFQINTASEIEATGGFVYWEEINDLVTNWYGLWPNATDKELEIAASVAKLHDDWWRSGGFYNQDPEKLDFLKEKFRNLIVNYANNDYPSSDSVF